MNTSLRIWVLVVVVALSGCDGRSYGDAGPGDGGTRDAGPADDGGTDAGTGTDAGPLPSTGSEPSPPAVVSRTGSGGLLLRGVVLTPDGPIDDGEVLIVDGEIRCVATSCDGTPGADTVTVIDTMGVISPVSSTHTTTSRTTSSPSGWRPRLTTTGTRGRT